jgi:hypothetical protein
MRSLLRTGFGLLILAFVLIGLSYGMLRAQGGTARSDHIRTRIVGDETRPVTRQVRAVELSGPIDLTLRYAIASRSRSSSPCRGSNGSASTAAATPASTAFRASGSNWN